MKNRATTGRVGVLYRFDNGLAPYASYTEAFVPNLGTDGTATASYLKPTTGEQTEAGLRFLSSSGDTSSALAWFEITQTNRIVDGLTPGGVEQVGARTRGWEADLRHRIGALELSANVADFTARNAVTGVRLSAIAEQTGSLWAQYRLPFGLRVGAGVRYIGDVTGANGQPRIPSVTLFDGMVGYAFDKFDVRLSVRNAADKQYISWCRGLNRDCGFGERRHVLLNAAYRF